ncbi:SMP-30/gluconolactonase/LRE family protein [Kineosporia rhizophila]|uniref:SMP-30/gluconolactonase/LRE family protein n=1 Tax=Kineosporia TaxID=49184 RepID=UPI001E4211B8|nr:MULTISPECIES: SMP-30/gluconolactonase/LRE family protein [Kineosporia]MCE0538558.1 SMP-30/gluconolactonase/LRE family protein [Kineosporia rhizophila]GLY19646.1 calcium-binding protein [Kineosporia sp. NBRC 101677]
MTASDSVWRIVSSTPHELGEGLRRVDGLVQWVDLLQGHAYSWDPASAEPGRLKHSAGRPLGVVEPGPDGRVLAAVGTGLAHLSPAGEFVTVADTGLDPARHRVNDGAFAPDGSFWFGTMVHDDSTPQGAQWRWDPLSGRLSQLRSGIDIPNGPTFLQDGQTALVADTSARRILRTSVRAPHEWETFAVVTGGSPDGMFTDDQNQVWNAVWGASRLDVYSSDGALLKRVPLPVSQPTSVLHMPGPDPLVVITSAAVGLDARGGLDGHTLAAPLSHL